MTMPPDEYDAQQSFPAAAPRASGDFDPGLPAFIPTARPITPEALAYAPSVLRPIGPARALFEMLMLLPAGFVGVMIGFIVAHRLGIRDEQWMGMALTVGMGLGALAAAAFFVVLDGRRAPDIGWRWQNLILDVFIGAAALVTTYVAAGTLALILTRLMPDRMERLAQYNNATRAVRESIPMMKGGRLLLVMTFVAVWEEVVFRGFLLTRLYALLRRWTLAVLVSAAIFGSVHLYEGPLAVVLIAILGIILALLFLARRSLVPCITMHFLHNTLMLLLISHGLLPDQ